jgi:hypothetical protein
VGTVDGGKVHSAANNVDPRQDREAIRASAFRHQNEGKWVQERQSEKEPIASGILKIKEKRVWDAQSAWRH